MCELVDTCDWPSDEGDSQREWERCACTFFHAWCIWRRRTCIWKLICRNTLPHVLRPSFNHSPTPKSRSKERERGKKIKKSKKQNTRSFTNFQTQCRHSYLSHKKKKKAIFIFSIWCKFTGFHPIVSGFVMWVLYYRWFSLVGTSPKGQFPVRKAVWIHGF